MSNDILTLEETKDWLKVDNTYDDSIIDALRETCTDYAELYTGLYFIERDIIITFAGLQNTKWESYPYIDIPKPLISSITKVEVIENDVSTVVSGTYYRFYNPTNIGRVIFTTTPTYDTDVPYPFTIYFKCGFGPTEFDTPDLIKIAIKSHVLYLYENRGDVQSEGGLSVPSETTELLNKYKVRYVT